MAYRLREDEPVVHGLVRIALEQIDCALAEIDRPTLPRPEAVHEVRKGCKKIRGLLRLLRTALAGVYAVEDDWFRDAAARLADVRAVDALRQAIESLRCQKKRAVDDAALDQIADFLFQGAAGPTQAEDIEARLLNFAEAMRTARPRIQRWSEDRIGADEIGAALTHGFTKTYRRGRQALHTARLVQADEYLHEFRKWAKYHWHHVKLLEELSPKKLRRRGRQLAKLSDWLGEDRDLGTLRSTMLERWKAAERSSENAQPAEHGLVGDSDQVDAVIDAIDARRIRLRTDAFRLAERLYDKKPKSYARWLGKRWDFPVT